MGVILALFTTSNYPLMALIEDIDLGKIGLPELQRPFVWPNVNVRDLFDSLYRGYPAGFLLFWETGVGTGLKGIRSEEHTSELQSLMRISYAVFCLKKKQIPRTHCLSRTVL